MFARVLIANRGEIAVRVTRTLRRLDVESVALYTDADADALHVRFADRAVRVASYLDIEGVVAAALRCGAEAVHPGYGFLSERPAFARACAEAGLAFVGPSAAAMALLGDKVAAKGVAEAAGVPVVPGLSAGAGGAPLTDEEIISWARGARPPAGREDGGELAGERSTAGGPAPGDAHERAASGSRLPLLLKAAAGGGGKGMRVVRALDELPEALGAARREAAAAFGDDRLLVERYVERSRHIEVQVMADAHGTVLHLGERECSLQRRHQKVIEEAPSPVVSPELRARMGAAACALARAAGYVGAGTVELIAERDDPSSFWFLEVNARLQVEHPVTELVTGLDLVELQLRVAAGEPLGLSQEDVRLTGHAVEARVYAEDPASGFLPSTGRVVAWREPAGALVAGAPSGEPCGVRVDAGIEEGSEVGSQFDPLLAKVIASGPDRAAALVRLDRALAELRVVGPTTNAPWLRALLARPEVREGELDTELIERLGEAVAVPAPAPDLPGLAVLALLGTPVSDDPWDRVDGWRLGGPAACAPARMRLDGPSGEVEAVAPTGGVRPVAGVVGSLHTRRPPSAAGSLDVGRLSGRLIIEGEEGELRAVGGEAGGLVIEEEGGELRAVGGEAGGLVIEGEGGELRAVGGEAGGLVIEEEGGVARTVGDEAGGSAGVRRVVEVYPDGDAVWLVDDGVPTRWAPAVDRAGARSGSGSLDAPMPGTVIDVRVEPGAAVAEGDTLVILESMKMELAIQAPADGVVADVFVAAGDRVAQSAPLVALTDAPVSLGVPPGDPERRTSEVGA